MAAARHGDCVNSLLRICNSLLRFVYFDALRQFWQWIDTGVPLPHKGTGAKSWLVALSARKCAANCRMSGLAASGGNAPRRTRDGRETAAASAGAAPLQD